MTAKVKIKLHDYASIYVYEREIKLTATFTSDGQGGGVIDKLTMEPIKQDTETHFYVDGQVCKFEVVSAEKYFDGLTLYNAERSTCTRKAGVSMKILIFDRKTSINPEYDPNGRLGKITRNVVFGKEL